MVRGVRGAISVEENKKEVIEQAARTLVTKIMSLNSFSPDLISAIIFSVTQDLTASFPATGLRQLKGFQLVPLFDTVEPNVEGSMKMCIRVLILVDTDKPPQEICHVYLGDAQKLRPDLAKK